MRKRRSILVWTALAPGGLVVAVGVSYAASRLAEPTVGLTDEPVSAGTRLAPARTAEDRPAPRPKRKRHRNRGGTPTTPAPAPAPALAPPATTAPPPARGGDDHGGHGGDDSGGRGRGGDDD